MTTTCLTNPSPSSPESSGFSRRAAVNHCELNDLQIHRVNRAGTSRAGVYQPDLTPFDLVHRLPLQTKSGTSYEGRRSGLYLMFEYLCGDVV